MKKKAQESRSDLVILYAGGLIIAIVIMGLLYGFGIIGKEATHGSLIESEDTTTAESVDIAEEEHTKIMNNTDKTISSADNENSANH